MHPALSAAIRPISRHWARILTGCVALGLITITQAEPLRFDHFSIEEGLSQSNVFAIAEDSRGHLWFGTESALDRFDGYEFKSFRSDPDDPNTLSFSRIYALDASIPDTLWVATGRGLDRMDLLKHSVQRHTRHDGESNIISHLAIDPSCPQQPLAITHSGQLMVADPVQSTLVRVQWPEAVTAPGVRSLVSGPEGQIWALSQTALWRWHCQSQHMEWLADVALADPRETSHSSLIAFDQAGQLLIATDQGLEVREPATGQLLGRMDPRQHGLNERALYAVAADRHGGVWLRSERNLIRLSPGQLLRDSPWTISLDLTSGGEVPSHRHPMRVATSGDGRVWVAGNFGLYTYKPGQGRLTSVAHDPARPDSLPQSVVGAGHQLLADRFGVVWIGTRLGGVARYTPQRHRFTTLRSDIASSDTIRGVSEAMIDGRRLIFSGIDDGGILVWETQADGAPVVVDHLHADLDAPQALPSNHIRSLAMQPDQRALWVWGDTWLGRIHLHNRHFELISQGHEVYDRYRHLQPDPRNQSILASSREHIKVVQLDTHEEPGTGDYQVTPLEWSAGLFEESSLPAVSSILVLRNGQIAIGLSNGWVLHDPVTSQSTHRLLHADQPWGSNNSVISLLESPAGVLWLGTHNGLARVDLAQPDKALWWTVADGLPDPTIYAMLAERDDALWLSTNRGLARLHASDGRIERFNRADGLRDYEFNSRVAHSGPSGTFYFGGISGLTYFDPLSIHPHPMPPDLMLQGLAINDVPMRWSNPNPDLRVAHHQNNIVFDFVGLHYTAPQLNQYRYRLDGLEANWIEAGTQRQVRYSGLNPGRYQFWLQAANADGVWSEPMPMASLYIRPPWWLSPWAYLAYFMLALGVLMMAVVNASRRRRQLEALVAERTSELDRQNEIVQQQAKALAEALDARTTLFANISHEFRTPLTLIQAALQQLETQREDSKAIPMAKRYIQRLTRLVDQLLDLSRLRMHGVQAADAPWSLTTILRITAEAFEAHAAQRGLRLETQLVDSWQTRCDQASVEKIVLNLLTNAIKFTPAGGTVSLRLEAQPDAQSVCIVVADTGPGIAKAMQEVVFERFQRLPAQEMTLIEGAGIGLALVREAAEAVGGAVALISDAGQGCEFRVTLPAEKAAAESTESFPPQFQSTERLTLDSTLLAEPSPETSADEAISADSELGTLLLVEDNRDLRDYLKELLCPDWQVVTAMHGEEALARLAEQPIDIILSDIMMPQMDGLELLQRVRDDLATSHIPFLILSARRDAETRIAGLSMAADDFLTKPFDARELQLKLRNMAVRRQSQTAALRGVLQTPTIQPPSSAREATADLSPRDQRFVQRLQQWLAAEYSNPDVSIADMACELAVDQRTLQRKVKALYDCAPSECLNEYRINRAQAALLESAQSIQEIAYDCGFNSPKSFSRTFQRHVGCSPSAWRNQHAA